MCGCLHGVMFSHTNVSHIHIPLMCPEVMFLMCPEVMFLMCPEVMLLVCPEVVFLMCPEVVFLMCPELVHPYYQLLPLYNGDSRE